MKKTLGRGSLGRALSLVVALAMVWGMCPTAGIAEEALGAAPEGGGALAEGGGAQAEGAPEAAEASEGA
ncbi:MAG: hypothetical protein IKG21_13665, partial [Atopobiaceae bacterium]|nr:hypothetical protein [Atopobiaceae bacterium]